MNEERKNESKEKRVLDLRDELQAVVNKTLEEENIDKTLFFFSLD